jgi:hypothetical protein
MISRRIGRRPACDAGTVPGDHLSRRRALVLGLSTALVASAGCSSQSAADPEPSDRPSVDPDLAIRAAAAQAERGLLAAYTATLARHPDLSQPLAAPSAHHAEHLAALAAATASPEATTTSRTAPVTPTATPAPSDTGAAAAIADDPLTATAALAAAEREAAAGRLDDLDRASPALARLLASVGAAEAAHAALLGS